MSLVTASMELEIGGMRFLMRIEEFTTTSWSVLLRLNALPASILPLSELLQPAPASPAPPARILRRLELLQTAPASTAPRARIRVGAIALAQTAQPERTLMPRA